MSSPGNRFLGGYGTFLRRFVGGYLLLCSVVLLTLLVADTVFPKARIYGRIADFLWACSAAAGSSVKP
jgi:hypothetical protein